MATTGQISLDIKYTFISFAQQYFAQHTKYTWDADVRNTKVIIADKNSIDLGVTVRRPTIVLSRGSFSFMKVGITQQVPGLPFMYDGNKELLDGPTGSSDNRKNTLFRDLIRGSVRYTVVAKHGVQAEEIADELLLALTAYQYDIKWKGIHTISDISMGEESLLRHSSDVELAAVPIDLRFTKNVKIARGEKQNNCRVYVDGAEVFESISFRIKTNGTQIEFSGAPDTDAELRITYVDAVTLETSTNVLLVGTPNGTLKTFTVPSSGSIYGYYEIMDAIDLTVQAGN